MSSPIIRRATVLATAVALAGLTALPVATAAQDELAQVRVLHGSGDAPAVDVYAGGDLIVEGLAFGSITDYLEVPAGEYQIQVVPAGATVEEGPVVIDATLVFGADTATTVAATGSLAEGIIPQVLPDDPSPSTDGTQVRVVHFAYDAPPVDIAPVGGDPLIAALGYPDNSGYADLPAGSYELEVRPAGTTDVVTTVGPLDLAAGTSYSAFAIGSLAGETFTVLPAVDAMVPTTAQVRLLHGSPDAPPIDIVVNGTRVFGNLPFGQASPYLTVPMGDVTIEVVPAGADDGEVVLGATLPFEPGTKTTIVASNSLENIEANVIEDRTNTKAKRAQLRVAHLSADAPRVDVAPDDSRPREALLKKVRYQDVSDYLTLKAGDYDLDIRRPGKRGVIFDIPEVSVERGTNYTAYAIGSPEDGSFTVVLLVDESA